MKKDYYPILLLGASVIILFGFLGAKEIWTQEWRWANIAHQMLLRHDYLHPMYENREYYDKPLLSYWLILLFTKLIGQLNTWAIRLPSAVSGLLTVFCTYLLGKKLFSKDVGLLSGALLITTFAFVFWSRVASTDILNVAGILAAITRYIYHQDSEKFYHYAVFFLIVCIAALLKGLIAPALIFLAILPTLFAQNRLKKHCNSRAIIAAAIALFLYLVPFWLSAHFNSRQYHESGLYEVFRENIIRYFKPFDHKGPIYTYFIYLPIYALPWTIFFIPALYNSLRNFKHQSFSTKWILWTIAVIFLFLSGSGSRRNYYLLPILPFVMIFTANWIQINLIKKRAVFYTALSSFALIIFIFCIAIPINYTFGNLNQFSEKVRQTASIKLPWQNWHIVLFDSPTIGFYLNSPNLMTFKYASKRHPGPADIKKDLPQLFKNDGKTLIILSKQYLPLLKNRLTQYKIIQAKPHLAQQLSRKEDLKIPVALIPKFKPTVIKTFSSAQS